MTFTSFGMKYLGFNSQMKPSNMLKVHMIVCYSHLIHTDNIVMTTPEMYYKFIMNHNSDS